MNRAPAPGNMSKMQAAQQEMEAVSDMYNKMVETCFKKCVGAKHSESDLNSAEETCLDRCVEKYVEAHNKVGQVMAGTR
eukprot:tig00000113_g5703.t1